MNLNRVSHGNMRPKPGIQLVGDGANREFRIFMSQKAAAQSLTQMCELYTDLDDRLKTQLIEFTGMAAAAGLLASLEQRISKKHSANTVKCVNEIYHSRNVPKTSPVRSLVPALINVGYVLHERILLRNPSDPEISVWNDEFNSWRHLQKSMNPPQDWVVFRRHDVPRP